MEKKIIRIVLLSCCLFAISFFNKSNAQCKLYVINVSNDTSSYVIPSGFPIKQNTGDSLVDANNYMAALTGWNNNTSTGSSVFLPAFSTATTQKIYIEISLVDFNQFEADRKNSILLYPKLYKVLQ
jgi:hypothetical protein